MRTSRIDSRIHSRTAGAALAVSGLLGLLGLSGCGGGGGGGGFADQGVKITSTALPSVLSGQVVNHLIPHEGGTGGPYLLERLAGTLPAGVGLDGGTVALVGLALEDGVFDFTLKLTDTGGVPFGVSIATFHWEIGIGALVFGTDPMLPGTVFNSFASIQLVVAGGVPPYSCEVIDLPGVADEPLPTGMSIPPDSCSIVGAPQQAHPGGVPFLVSVRATDSTPGTPLTAVRTFQLPILIPPIILTTLDVPDGKCGTDYNAQIDVADGVPPFLFSVVDPNLDIGVLPYDVQAHRLRGEPGSPNGVAKGSPTSAYAAEATPGPYSGKFPEGLILRDNGSLFGIPRRMGSFGGWTYHVQSTLLPSESSQNQWKSYSFQMSEGVAPNLVMDPLSMPAGQGYVAPNNAIPDLEVGVSYAQSFNGLNGVADDGKWDSPHEADALAKPGETAAKYDWSASTFQVAGRPGNLGMQFTAAGVFQTTSPAGVTGTKGGYENLSLVLRDAQLPTANRHQVTGTVRFSVGPDVVIITEATTGGTSKTPDLAYDTPSQTVEVLEPLAGGMQVRALTSSDMAATHANPTGASLATALSGIDFLSVTTNPTWWAYDNFNLNAQGARGFQHADPERMFMHTDFNSDNQWTQKNYGYYSPSGGLEHASNSATELPEVTSGVTHDPAAGVYANGGLLYGYDNPTTGEFGFLVVRKDSKVYVPFSMVRGTSNKGFGDAWCVSSVNGSSTLRKPQITVSPDGRWAAAKIKTDVNNWLETANVSQVVLFSLCGEKPAFFGGQTYRVISSGANGSNNNGYYLYADSLTLTNRYLYWMTGNFSGNTNSSVAANYPSYVFHQEHWVWRYDLTRTSGPFAGTLLAPNGVNTGGTSGVSSSYWANDAANYTTGLSTTWHRWSYPGTGSNSTYNYISYEPTISTYAGVSYTGSSYAAFDFFSGNFANFAENSMAPTPFRVSRNGRACAIVAAPNTYAGTTSGSVNFQSYRIFVDWDTASSSFDSSDFRMATSATSRRYRGASRIGGLRKADSGIGYSLSTSWGSYMAGWFDGPATQMEVSDDGLFVAAVYNTYTGGWSTGQGQYNAPYAREDVALLSATGSGSTPWSGTSERTNITTGVFTGSSIWRFGCLAFTRDSSGFVFWGGYSLSSATSTSYAYANLCFLSGSLYAYNIATDTRQGILMYSDGGQSNTTSGPRTYSTGSPNTATPVTWSGDPMGSVLPMGAFYSNDGKFFYVESLGALNSSDPTAHRLIGVNVAGNPATPANTINGRTPLVAFAPSYPSQRSFAYATYSSYPSPCYQMLGVSGPAAKIGTQVSCAGTNGRMFFAGYYQGTYSYSYQAGGQMYLYYGGPARYTYADGTGYIYYGCYAYSAEIMTMDTSVGSDVSQVTSFGGTQTPLRVVSYLQPNRSGSRLAYVQYAPSSSYGPYWGHAEDTETVVLVTNLGFSATTGAMSGTPGVAVLEPTVGRAGVSMSFDYADSALIYAFGPGTSGEAGQQLTRRKFDPMSGSVTATTQRGGINNTAARFAILNSGR